MNLDPKRNMRAVSWRNGLSGERVRALPAEVPIAFVYDGSAEAVMMATPADLEEFALGFSLNERVISSPDDLISLDVVEAGRGIELRLQLKPAAREAMAIRRRRRAGPIGCGLCGIESLEDALPALPRVTASLSLPVAEIVAAMRAMAPLQTLNAETRAVHAAALYVPGHGFAAVREDVGRHNALDKLAGALAVARASADRGAILITSRLSVELVQKAATMGAPIVAAVSAPTTLAIAEAEAAGVTLAGIVREDGLEVFTHPSRIKTEAATDAR